MKRTNINYNKISINNTVKLNINHNSFSLPINLHYILIGIILGDGSLQRSSSKSNVRLEMSFGQKYEELALFFRKPI
jgi:hypothetical protein